MSNHPAHASFLEPPPGLIAQIRQVLFQPRAFFASLNRSSSQWLLIALLVAGLVAFSAIQAMPAAISIPVDGGPPPGMPFEGEFPPDIAMPVDPGTVAPSGSGSPTWTVALSAAGGLVIQWLVLAILLGEISMLNRKQPDMSLNGQIVVYASLPLALMAAIQALYLSGGNTISNPGFTGYLLENESYLAWSLPLQSLAYGFATHLTLFWLWQMGLLYIAGRVALHGKRWAVLLVIALWVLLLSITTGYGYYQQHEAGSAGDVSSEMPFEPPIDTMPPDTGEMPFEPDVITEEIPPENSFSSDGMPLPEDVLPEESLP